MDLADHKKRPYSLPVCSLEDLRALANRYQKRLEDEQSWLARELHDDLAQKVTVLSLELALLGDDHGQPRLALREKVEELSDLVSDLIHSIREMKTQLRPKLLDEFGLAAALGWRAENFQKGTGIRCSVQAQPDPVSLSPEAKIQLYRIFEELMRNVHAHANAHVVQVRLWQQGAWFLMEVHDDGQGLREDRLMASTSLGLREVSERARSLGGEVSWDGTPNQGTTVCVKVPLAATVETDARARTGGSPP